MYHYKYNELTVRSTAQIFQKQKTKQNANGTQSLFSISRVHKTNWKLKFKYVFRYMYAI